MSHWVGAKAASEILADAGLRSRFCSSAKGRCGILIVDIIEISR